MNAAVNAAARITFESVTTPAQIQAVADLAAPIWREQFTPIIGSAQVAYMLQAWQSPSAIAQQMQEGAHYFLTRLPEAYIGYFSWTPDTATSGKISKFYLLHTYHGKGYAQAMMQFLEKEAIQKHISILWLRVNRHNHKAIRFYHKSGFHIVRDIYEEIAPGYYLDDHIMEKCLQHGSSA